MKVSSRVIPEVVKKSTTSTTKATKSRNNNKETAKNKKVISIVGDSTLKEVRGHELSTVEKRVLVKSFPGAKLYERLCKTNDDIQTRLLDSALGY